MVWTCTADFNKNVPSGGSPAVHSLFEYPTKVNSARKCVRHPCRFSSAVYCMHAVIEQTLSTTAAIN